MRNTTYLAALLATAFSTSAFAQPKAAREPSKVDAAPRTIYQVANAQEGAWCRAVFLDAATGPDILTIHRGRLQPGQNTPAASEPGERVAIITARSGTDPASAARIGQFACKIAAPESVASGPVRN